MLAVGLVSRSHKKLKRAIGSNAACWRRISSRATSGEWRSRLTSKLLCSASSTAACSGRGSTPPGAAMPDKALGPRPTWAGYASWKYLLKAPGISAPATGTAVIATQKRMTGKDGRIFLFIKDTGPEKLKLMTPEP